MRLTQLRIYRYETDPVLLEGIDYVACISSL